MRTLRPLHVFLLSLLLSAGVGFCQTGPRIAPLPGDSLELATGTTHVAGTPQDRAAMIDLMERARENADLHAPGSAGFTLKVSFSAAGSVPQTGAGDMEETWFGPYAFRWAVRLGDYSLTRISTGGRVYDDKPADFVPMRVHMLRSAIFWPINFHSGHTLIRTAAANWKGSQVTCILTSGDGSDPTETPGRRWAESEYCVDAKTGLLQILSDAPGIYVVYDYSNALSFHGRTVARQISIVEGGNTVLEAHVDSIVEAPGSSPAVLTPTEQMRGLRAGPLLAGTMRFPRIVTVAPGASTVQPVIVHAILGENGKVMDAELVERSGGALGQSALDIVRRSTYPLEQQNGRRQYEAFINVKFVSE